MPFKNKIAAALCGLVVLPVAAAAGVIGGTYYAPQYDFREFFAATDGRNFQVILAGNPFPGVDPNTVARDLLPARGVVLILGDAAGRDRHDELDRAARIGLRERGAAHCREQADKRGEQHSLAH